MTDLAPAMDPVQEHADFLALLASSIDGEVDSSVGARARYSTDAGNYRVVPLAVVAPRSTDDVVEALRLCREHGVPLTPRGGGTSCAGNAVGPGIVLDFTIHLNRVTSIDPEARTAVVEPGCIQQTLQDAAKPHGLRFGPDPSSQNRCSIAGMVGNNACGPHATAWGRTADNIISMDVVDGLGRRYTVGPDGQGLDRVPGLQDLIDANLPLIRRELGRFGRQVSGYSLEHLTPEGHRDLARMMVGTEGTLATVLSVTVRLVDLPAAPVLVALGYPDMIAAADDVPTILRHKPLAAEGLDSRLVDVVRRHKGDGAIPELPAGEGWMMVEMGGEDIDDSLARAHAMAADAHTDAVAVYPPGEDAVRLWRIRADGAGLGGRTPYDPATGKGKEPGWPGFEDAAVPPENLGDYLRDFTALMKEFDIDGLLYGHFGDGCVHVRLDMPLDTPAGVAHSRRFLERAAQVCARHGGSVSGEHGDGRSRSELLQFMYSPEMLDLFASVKALFDPANMMNPGVLTAPNDARAIDKLDDFLRRTDAKPQPALAGGFQFTEDHGDFTAAVHRCTGVGKCRASVPGTFMCPTWRATHDEKDVTRGRARTLQEAANGSLVRGVAAPELWESLDLCLACKACSSDCPAGVDMSKYKSEVLYRRYRGKVRPLSHYALGRLPTWTGLTARIPGLAALGNLAFKVPGVRQLAFGMIGLDARRPMLRLQSGTFGKWARGQGLGASSSPSIDEGGRGGAAARYVVLWADSFSQTLDDEGARAMVRVLQDNGFTVIVPDDDVCCGLTGITTGQLDLTRKRLDDLLGVLAPFATNGIPIVGVEPSCTAVLRDDMTDLLPDDPRAAAVSGAVRTLAEVLATVPEDEQRLPDLGGVEVVAQPHCHHYSVMGWDTDRALLERLGATVTIAEGCCGLAGIFGMEKGHYEMSVAVAENSLLPSLREHPDAIYLADGFSCRTQAAQLADRGGMHLATLLARRG